MLKNVTDAGFLATDIVDNGVLEFQTDTADLVYSGAISGTGELRKTGTEMLTLGGSTGNTYAGMTTVARGSMTLDKSSGVAIPGDVTFVGENSSAIYFNRSEQIASSAVVYFNKTASALGRLLLHGNNQTLAGLSDPTGHGAVQVVHTEEGYSANSTLTVNNTEDYVFTGYLRDKSGGGSTGKVALVKSGTGTLTLSGGHIPFTGDVTVDGGNLVGEWPVPTPSASGTTRGPSRSTRARCSPSPPWTCTVCTTRRTRHF